MLLIDGLRLAMYQYFMGDWYSVTQSAPSLNHQGDLSGVAIYGVGVVGNQPVAALRLGRAMRLVAFIDDGKQIANRVVTDLWVCIAKHICRMINETGTQKVPLAIPSATRIRHREILESLEPLLLYVHNMPGFMDLASGRVKVGDLQEMDIADLLRRDSVAPYEELLERCIRGQVAVVTGMGDSIGSEFCRQIISCSSNVSVLFEHSEYSLYSIHQELEHRIRHESLSVNLLPILGSMHSPERPVDVMRTWKINTVCHAAVYERVPIVEYNVVGGVLNNVIGILHAVQAAVQVGVQSFVLISIDRTVRSTNVMGSTKRLAEMILQALSSEPVPVPLGDRRDVHYANKARFTVIRFSNVLSLSSSVTPLFHEQVKRGDPATIIHPSITRYSMTTPGTTRLVIQTGSTGQGGDVLVLDTGSPVKILELAEKMIHLSGLSVYSERSSHGDIATKFSGLRPGEKFYEELLIGDSVNPTDHPMIMRINEKHLSWEVFKAVLGQLLAAVGKDDYSRVCQSLRETASSYAPDDKIVDRIYRQRRREP